MDIQTLLILSLLILLVDIPWLMYIGEKFGAMVTRIQGGRPMEARIFGAIPVYLALAWILSKATNVKDAFLYGFCTYIVYDFTNFATLKNYDLSIGVMDSLWGGTLFMIAFSIAKYAKIL